MTKQRKPAFYKQSWFLGLVAVSGLVGGLAGIFNGMKPNFEAKPPPRVSQNTEIVLDLSEGMKQRLTDGTTKLALAGEAVNRVLSNQIGSNLAFRTFGGSCADLAYPPPMFPFSQYNAERVREKLKGLKPTGEAVLFAAIRAAVADLRDSRFDGLQKRIIVVTGNLNACGDPILAIADDLKKRGDTPPSIVLDLDFIGIGFGSADKMQLDQIAELTGGAAHFADNLQQLDNVVEVIEVVRVKRAAVSVSGLLKASAERLSPAIANLKNKDYAAAQRGLQDARDEFAHSELPFQDLVKRQTGEHLTAPLSAQYRRIYQAANRSREIQGQVISLTETMLSQAKAADDRAREASIDKYEEMRAAYNKSDDELQALLVQLDAIARLGAAAPR
jgi:hypothetical protein